MTTVSELIRSRATQIGEIRRTGRQDLASNLLRDLFVIAEAVETATPADKIAGLLSDGLAMPEPPVPSYVDAATLPFIATFTGQQWIGDTAYPVEGAVYSFSVSEAEALEAAGVTDASDLCDAVEFDALQDAELAPSSVRSWTGPFEITIERRAYRIEGDPEGTVYADDLSQLRERLVYRFVRAAKSMDLSLGLTQDIHEIKTSDLETPGDIVRLGGHGLTLTVTAQGQDLAYLQQAVS